MHTVRKTRNTVRMTRIQHANCATKMTTTSLMHIMPQSQCAESTLERGRIDHSSLFGVAFQSIPIHSNSVLLMHIGSAGEYESFEHVQKLCVACANKFHSCLCALKTCSYHVCRTAYVLYSSHSHYILTVFWLFLLYTR